MATGGAVGVRWTIGDVSARGFEALRLSILGAQQVFGAGAAYAVTVNSLPVEAARARVGAVRHPVRWLAADRDLLPSFLRPHLGPGMAEGVAWKLAPLRLFPGRHEVALDNDVVLWSLPPAVEAWLADRDPRRALLAPDVVPAFGQFARFCPGGPRNTGIRGLPPGLDLGAALEEVLRLHPVVLASELDEQGLQVAALSRPARPHVVAVEDVSVCSPFPPHVPWLGRCGAHFVGVNARRLPFEFYGRPATDVRAEHWDALRGELYARVGARPLEAAGGGVSASPAPPA